MKISTRTRYGIRTMLEIATGKPNAGIFQKDIARNQAISNKYLDHIIHALKASQLICNVKGKKSGYMLTRKPSEISLYDIHNAFEPGICIIECLSGNYECKRQTDCLAIGFWKNLNGLIVDYFKSVTIDDLIKKKIKTIKNVF
ncbi:Rrf2 family transcriptional regulator [Candidatus Gottesmanbacteria bacterium RBG_13_37_7]|uniref:Rrf2 family transcriptional regulator n=1 Tax=Candidatus Gottesmanbacteria bacterium RBG_13_37_7 TaxID=1798369 RepID=A0A1F5YIS3_9BACT|nr:MAG: Rrf2 family transcriptional regulator [Candidatus Gottesmanbacteria bacterium RBG_13_37_7]